MNTERSGAFVVDRPVTCVALARACWARLQMSMARVDEQEQVVLIDSTVVLAHPDAAGSRSGDAEHEALGRSRGGFTTKVRALVSPRGRWRAFLLTPGQPSDVTQALGARAYDADAVLAWCTANEAGAVVPSRRSRRLARVLDRGAYALRNVIERFFGRLKRFRRVGRRYDKTAASFSAFGALGALSKPESPVRAPEWPPRRGAWKRSTRLKELSPGSTGAS